MRVDAKGGDLVWKVLYEAKSQIIRAADVHARAFLGCWVRLVRELRAPYASAIQGLAPMGSPPPIAGGEGVSRFRAHIHRRRVATDR
jgi:hypothetical protein